MKDFFFHLYSEHGDKKVKNIKDSDYYVKRKGCDDEGPVSGVVAIPLEAFHQSIVVEAKPIFLQVGVSVCHYGNHVV